MPLKIAILVREETTKRCTGKGCLRSFFEKTESFARYRGQHVELVAFFHTGGDLDHKLAKLKKSGVEVIHLSTCLRGKDPNYHRFIEQVSRDFTVVGYTHGSEEAKVPSPFPVSSKG
ncbi:MAG: CGGC domain-containing protein [Desulforhopalus sp.]|nr:CGGC domain-containing protein [Desulforhopalus sp.]